MLKYKYRGFKGLGDLTRRWDFGATWLSSMLKMRTSGSTNDVEGSGVTGMWKLFAGF